MGDTGANTDYQNASDADDEDDSVAIVAGTVAGLLVLIAIVAGLAAYFISKKRRQAKSELSGNVTQTTMKCSTSANDYISLHCQCSIRAVSDFSGKFCHTDASYLCCLG